MTTTATLVGSPEELPRRQRAHHEFGGVVRSANGSSRDAEAAERVYQWMIAQGWGKPAAAQ